MLNSINDLIDSEIFAVINPVNTVYVPMDTFDKILYEQLKEKVEEHIELADDLVNLIGKPNGFATLNESGQIPATQLPSYVDDIIEGHLESKTDFRGPDAYLVKPEQGKIYFDISTGLCYRWSGSEFVSISSPVELGTGVGQAYPGNAGQALADKVSELESGGFVKPTDLATVDKAGVGKVNKYYGVYIQDGFFAVNSASNWAIDNRNDKSSIGNDAYFVPITRLDYSVLKAITTNSLELSDDSTDESGNAVEGDKTKACKWLGASRATNIKNAKGEYSIQSIDGSGANGKRSIAWGSACGGDYSIAGGVSGGLYGGRCSILWGQNCGAYGSFSLIFGDMAFAESTATKFAFLYGDRVKTAEDMSIVFGQYNAYEDEKDYLFMLGNGKSDTERNNALIVYKDGHAKFDGTVEVEAPQNDKDAVNKKHAEDNFVKRNFVSSNGVYGKRDTVEHFYELSQWTTGDTVARRTNKGGLRVFLDETNANPEEMATPRGYVDGRTLQYENVVYCDLESVDDSDYTYDEVYFRFCTKNKLAVTDTAALAKALYDNGFTSVDKAAIVHHNEGTTGGYSTSRPILVYSADGSTFTLVTKGGTNHTVAMDQMYLVSTKRF